MFANIKNISEMRIMYFSLSDHDPDNVLLRHKAEVAAVVGKQGQQVQSEPGIDI